MRRIASQDGLELFYKFAWHGRNDEMFKASALSANVRCAFCKF